MWAKQGLSALPASDCNVPARVIRNGSDYPPPYKTNADQTLTGGEDDPTGNVVHGVGLVHPQHRKSHSVSINQVRTVLKQT